MAFKPIFVSKNNPESQGGSLASTSTDMAVIEESVKTVVLSYQNEIEQCLLDSDEVTQNVMSQLSNIDIYSPSGIATLGQVSAERISSYSDDMLKHVRCNDLEDMGKNLTEVIGLAKGVKIDALMGENNVFSRIVSKIKNTKEKILAHFNSVNTQLDRLIKEVDKQQSSLQERANQLDTVFFHNMAEYKELSLSIIYGESKLQIINKKITEMSEQATLSPFVAQQLNDLKDTATRIEKRVHDLKSLQTMALQTAPMIRMVQSSNILLVEKFQNIKMLTIPAWKKQFTLAISMIEQKKSIQLSNKIDDATNDLIRKNADLLRQNTLAVAQSSQRSIVDVETLEHVQNTLISTLQDVVSIEQEGSRQRLAASQKMESMKTELLTVLSN